MIDPSDQDAETYSRTPGLLDGRLASQETPSLEMRQAPDREADGSAGIDIDPSAQILDAILQELRSLNQNIREIM
jgi:hypothetical protein